MRKIKLRHLIEGKYIDLSCSIRLLGTGNSSFTGKWLTEIIPGMDIEGSKVLKEHGEDEVSFMKALTDENGKPFLRIGVEPPPLKAYEVDAPGYDMMDLEYSVVFAENDGKAKYLASSVNNLEFTAVSIRRLPWADKYQDADNIPADVFLAHGWGCCCYNCGEMFFSDDEGYKTIGRFALCPECAKDQKNMDKIIKANYYEDKGGTANE